MKTLKRGRGEYKRVPDSVARRLVHFDGWSYCPKREWKVNVRDAGNRAKEA